jgi:hypothetical protein
VFPVPEATFPSSHQAVIAVRTWINPTVLSLDEFTSTFTVADTDTQRALAREARYSPVLGQLPFAIVGVLLVLLGFVLLTVGIALRRRELLLFGIILIAGPLQALLYELTDARALPLPMWLYAPLTSALLCIVPVSYVEFIWYAFRLGGQRWKLLLQALSIFSALALLPMMVSSRLEVSSAFDRISAGGGMLRDVLEASAAAWAMRTRRSQRWLAFAVFLTPGASFFALMAGYFAPPRWSGVADNLFNDSEVAGALLITAILVTRAWQAWRAGDELRIEFEAAAEVQQQLVSPAVDLPGFQIRSIYLPARQVGGDFFRVLHQADGGVLVVMGDVSGKGLKAAMTVSAIMGALPGCRSRRPSDVLAHLNEAVYGRISGFVTCCAVHISIDGAMTLANAGNPAPYRNGQEMVVESGLPLGVLADVSYPETSDQLAVGDRLTFVSDGVIEATSASGELYGFDRTQATSAEDASQIAQAAQAFGQDDDITVLTLVRHGGRDA